MKLNHTRRSNKGLFQQFLFACACASGFLPAAHAASQRVGAVFYILMENRNFTSDGTDNASGGVPLVGSTAAPYINSLITPGNANAAQVSYCTAYHSVLATATGTPPSIHPSEPNYLWMEAGSNFGVLNDNDPYGSNKQVQVINTFLSNNPSLSGQNLSTMLSTAGISWHSYQEGTNLLTSTSVNSNLGTNSTTNTLTNSVVVGNTTVPLVSFSGSNTTYTNPYNGSHQWNFACKHDGSIFFPGSNGSTVTVANTGTSNPFASSYLPLEQLQHDLDNNTVAQYNVITPDQFNDMHTALSSGFTYNGTHYTGDLAQVAQGDNFLAMIVPKIMASQAYQNNGVIVIWTDETEGDSARDTFNHTLMEIVISPLAKGNAYASTLNYTHSSDLNTMQKIYQVTAHTASGFINDAANPSNSSGALAGTVTGAAGTAEEGIVVGYGTGTAYDLSDLFVSGVIPTSIPSAKAVLGPYTINRRSSMVTQTVTVSNLLAGPTQPLYLAIENVSGNTSVLNPSGTIQNSANGTVGTPYITIASTGMVNNGTATITVNFAQPTSGGVSANLRVMAVASGTP